SPKSGPSCDRLSIRRADENHYVEAVRLPENITVMDFALSETTSALYFITGTITPDEHGGASGDWDGLYRYDISSRTHELVARDGGLRANGNYSRLWPIRVLAVGDEERIVYVVAGMERSPDDLAYHICSLSRDDLFLTPITELQAIFA